MGDSSSDGGANYTCNIGVDVDGNSCNYGLPKEPKRELDTADYSGNQDACDEYVGVEACYNFPKEEAVPELRAGYCPPKKEPKLEPAASDGTDGDNYARDIAVALYCHPIKEEPEPELGGGSGEAVDVNSYREYGQPKEELESELSGDGSDENTCNIVANTDDCYYDPPKDEPEFVVLGDDAAVDGPQDFGYYCSHCRVNLCTQKFKVEHEARCKVQMQRRELESQVTEVYHCGYCRCPFLNKEYQEQHERKWCRKRPVVAKKDSSGPYFKCDQCEYVAKRKQSLERHILKHNTNSVEWLTCTQCSYKTMYKRDMTTHVEIHSDKFSLCCPVCGKSFRRKQGLDDHLLKRHSDESLEVSKWITTKIHTCNICDKYRTTVKSSFNQHLAVTHNKGVGCEKYQCPRCPYSTFRKANLQWHLKTHAEQKDYWCPICKKQFIRKFLFDSHILRNHGDDVDLMKTITSKIHRCELCSFKTTLLSDLKRHVRSKHV